MMATGSGLVNNWEQAVRTHLCWKMRFFRHPVERLFNNVDIRCTTSYPEPLRRSPGYDVDSISVCQCVDPIMVFRVSTAHPNDAFCVEIDYSVEL